MITVITGKIGGGKSLLALTFMLAQFAKGGCVVSNFTLNEENLDRYLKKHHRRNLVEGMHQFHDFESEPEFQKSVPFGIPGLPVLVLVDEAQLYYNQAESARLQSRMMRLVSFLTQSRKCAVDVIFITQHDTTIWAQFRHQCLFGYKCRDMRAVSLPFIGQIASLGLCWVKYDILSGEIMERGRTPLSPELFGLYDTRQMYDSQMRDLQSSATVWQPVPKNQKGKFDEIDLDCDSVPRRGFLLWLENLLSFFGSKGSRAGGTAEGSGGAGKEKGG